MTKFGASFKKARRAKGITLNSIAEETRISTRFLQAIENEDFRVLPGGIFNRGFIRAYAQRVGLDADQAVADYERIAQLREPVEHRGPSARRASSAERNLYPIAALALILLIVGFYAVTRNTATGPPIGPQTAGANGSPLEQPAMPPSPVELDPARRTDALNSEFPDPLTLEMEALEPTWIRLTVDGAAMSGEILQPGSTRRYNADASITITVGNAGGLSLRLNGQDLPPLGRSGQVRILTITPENVDGFIG